MSSQKSNAAGNLAEMMAKLPKEDVGYCVRLIVSGDPSVAWPLSRLDEAQDLVALKIAPCFGGGHVWRKTTMLFCDSCGNHGGFTCDLCDRCIDSVWDRDLSHAVVQIGYLPEQEEDDDEL